MKYVTIMTIPGKSVQVEVEDDASIAFIAQKAGFDITGMSITCTAPAEGANAATVPGDGATICLTRQVKGAGTRQLAQMGRLRLIWLGA